MQQLQIRFNVPSAIIPSYRHPVAIYTDYWGYTCHAHVALKDVPVHLLQQFIFRFKRVIARFI